MLLINGDKSQIITICKPYLRNKAKDIFVKAGQHIIAQTDSLKILGYILSNDLKHDKYINNIVSNINYKIHVLCKIKHFTSITTRRIIATGIIMSKINYLLPILVNMSTKNHSDLNK